MKTKLTLGATLAFAVAAVLAAPVIAKNGPGPKKPTGPAAASSNAPTASATGSGHALVTGQRRTFAFTARSRADGTSRGQAQLFNRAQGRRSHLVLDCLVVVGNRAFMSGTIRKSSIATDVGTYWNFAVEDNGQGANASPDRITLAFTFGPAFRCDNAAVQGFLVGQFFPIEDGNVQVH